MVTVATVCPLSNLAHDDVHEHVVGDGASFDAFQPATARRVRIRQAEMLQRIREWLEGSVVAEGYGSLLTT